MSDYSCAKFHSKLGLLPWHVVDLRTFWSRRLYSYDIHVMGVSSKRTFDAHPMESSNSIYTKCGCKWGVPTQKNTMSRKLSDELINTWGRISWKSTMDFAGRCFDSLRFSWSSQSLKPRIATVVHSDQNFGPIPQPVQCSSLASPLMDY